MINNALKKIVSIKMESILSILYFMYMTINIYKSSLLVASIVLHLTMLIGVYYVTYTLRQELKEYVYNLEPIKIIDVRAIKKEIFNKVFNYNRPRLKLNVSTFLNNSN